MTRRTWPSSETDLDFGLLGEVVFDGNLEMRQMKDAWKKQYRTGHICCFAASFENPCVIGSITRFVEGEEMGKARNAVSSAVAVLFARRGTLLRNAPTLNLVQATKCVCFSRDTSALRKHDTIREGSRFGRKEAGPRAAACPPWPNCRFAAVR